MAMFAPVLHDEDGYGDRNGDEDDGDDARDVHRVC